MQHSDYPAWVVVELEQTVEMNRRHLLFAMLVLLLFGAPGQGQGAGSHFVVWDFTPGRSPSYEAAGIEGSNVTTNGVTELSNSHGGNPSPYP